MRRVVIGVDQDHRTRVVEDVDLAEPRASSPFVTIWEADAPYRVPSDGLHPATTPDLFPPVGGHRTLRYSLAPGFGVTPPPEYDGPEPERNATQAGALHVRPGDAPGVHRTNSVDVELILTGQIDLELDDGIVVTLRPGDWVVQNGTRHAWRNPYDVECQMVAFFVGAPGPDRPGTADPA